MRRIIYGLLLLMILSVASCDRFKHTFEPEVATDAEDIVFNPLRSAFENISATDVSAVMSFYDDDYLHNGQYKANREDFYLGLYAKSGAVSFQVNLIAAQEITEGDTLSLTTWQLIAFNNAKQIIADSTFYGEELIKRGNSWKLYGNRDSCCNPVTYKQRVFAETFTYTTCPNCPAVEALLHQMQQAHPTNFSYLEYHMSDPLDMGNYDLYGYYAIPNMPSVVFQGQNLIVGNNADNEQMFNQLYNQLAGVDSKIDFGALSYNLVGNVLTGSIRLTLKEQGIDLSRLVLKYAIIDKVTDPAVYHNSQQEPCRNVVLTKGTKSLQSADFSQPIGFNLPFSSLPTGYAGALPADSYLVMWVQNVPDTFDANAPIYNGIEAPLTVSKHIIKK